ncbi:MAG: sel1 repeat family protein [Alphaproteobacteria bacterium]|nr:MAG: sel1 repeat family protein [Alphaproteobacteria bacterium]
MKLLYSILAIAVMSLFANPAHANCTISYSAYHCLYLLVALFILGTVSTLIGFGKLLDLHELKSEAGTPSQVVIDYKNLKKKVILFFALAALLLTLPAAFLYKRATLPCCRPGRLTNIEQCGLSGCTKCDVLKMAQREDADAQEVLGSQYERHNDYEAAAKWYRLAAAQGNTGAMFALSTLYEGGYGVKRDLGEAYFWCRLNLQIAATPFRDIVQQRKNLETHLTPEQVKTVEDRVKEWRPAPSPVTIAEREKRDMTSKPRAPSPPFGYFWNYCF